ncbi:hypothetical protein ABEB36_000612 [Hypothenemus hampei]|uniref:Uncharacterized protein n=1 Tax=Hypothenemus hampei TaxID=57062 RepID=A0ABD1FBV4_HYPHA
MGYHSVEISGIFYILLLPVLRASISNVCLDVNDILSTNWMPSSILEKIYANQRQDNVSSIVNEDVSHKELMDGTIGNALTTMTFHRSMMNQYLCRNFVANQILSQMTRESSFHKRMDGPEGEEFNSSHVENLKTNLLSDSGSSSYEDWLKKSATFEDIYRHHSKINELKEAPSRMVPKKFENINAKTKIDYDYHGVPGVKKITISSIKKKVYFVDYVINDGGGYHLFESSPHYPHPTSHRPTYLDKDYKKDEKITDFFEIALTALAFLSFGMFVIHLIMSISAVHNNNNNNNYYPSTPNPRIVALNIRPAALNEDTEEADDFSTNSDDYIKFRSVKDIPHKVTANELTKHLLKVLDAALHSSKDNAKCLKNALCKATKSSRDAHGGNRLFMTLWSFGTAWLAGNLSNQQISKTEGFQAVLAGIGLANCNNIYPCIN